MQMTPTGRSTGPRTLFSVQIARGVAATAVVLAHANLIIDSRLFHGWLVTGWCGVDFFFVLSGFIICYANSADIGHAERLPIYLYKRFVRVYPVYWLYTAAALLLDLAMAIVSHKYLISWIHLDFGNLLRCATLYPTRTSPQARCLLFQSRGLSAMKCCSILFSASSSDYGHASRSQ